MSAKNIIGTSTGAPGSNIASAQYLIGKTLPEPIQPLAARYLTRIDFAHINVAAGNTPQPTHRLELE
ncbi:MAG: hypothetical protein WBX25_10760 [Rhodomicrobium sp.]